MKILHITDIHAERPPERINPGIGAVLDRARAIVRSEAPDYLLVTGDLTSHGSSHIEELEFARQWLDSLGAPYLAIAGNHDLGANARRGAQYPELERHDPRPLADTHFGRVFGPDALVTCDLGPLFAVGLSLRAGDPDGVLPKLARLLDRVAKPVVLLGHYPLVPTRTTGVLSRFGAGDFIADLVEPLVQIIQAHPVVKAYLAGHVHAVSARPITARCLQLTAGGFGPGASAYRVYDLSPGRLGYTTRLGAGPLGFWERVVPSEAPFPTDYHLGTAAERVGALDLALDA